MAKLFATTARLLEERDSFKAEYTAKQFNNAAGSFYFAARRQENTAPYDTAGPGMTGAGCVIWRSVLVVPAKDFGKGSCSGSKRNSMPGCGWNNNSS